MDLLLNDVFNLSVTEIENSRIELNMTEGAGGISYIDKWLSLEQMVRDSGITDCLAFYFCSRNN